jgi:hypothetical protein
LQCFPMLPALFSQVFPSCFYPLYTKTIAHKYWRTASTHTD